MSNHRNRPEQSIDEISRIRQRLNDINDMHHRNIRDQLEMAMCKMMAFLNEKPAILEGYIRNLRNVSTDDIGQALLDNILEQIKQIKTEINDTVKLPEDDPITELEDANNVHSKNQVLLGLVNRIQAIEKALHTHVGESTNEEN